MAIRIGLAKVAGTFRNWWWDSVRTQLRDDCTFSPSIAEVLRRADDRIRRELNRSTRKKGGADGE